MERPCVAGVRRLTTDVGPLRKGVDQVLAWRIHVHPRAEVAEIRPGPPVGGQRTDPDNLGKRCWPERLALGVVSGCGDQRDALVMAEPIPEVFEAQRWKVAAGESARRQADNVGAAPQCRV